MKKTISTLTALSLAMTACTSEKTVYQYQNQPKSEAEVQKPLAVELWEDDFAVLAKMLETTYPHLGVAEYLAQSIKKRHPQVLSRLQSQPEWSVLEIQEATRAEVKANYEKYFFGESRSRSNPSYIENMIAGEKVDKTAFHSRIQIQTVALAQGAALRKIFDIFNQQLDKNTNELAREMVEDLSKNDPQVIEAIDKLVSEDTRLQAELIRDLLKRYDRVLAKYDFAQEDSIKLVIYGLVAQRLYVVLQNDSTVKSILKTVEKVRDIGKKVREIRFTLGAMDKYRRDLKKNWEDVSSSFKAMKDDLNYYHSKMGGLSEQSKSAVADAIYDVFDGSFEEPLKGDKKSILSQEHPLDENVKKFVNSTAAAAQSFDNIVGALNNLSTALGVDIPEDVQNVIATAQKISAGIQLGSAVITAFSSGGMLGVATALSGGPAAMILAGGLSGALGGGGQAAALAEIKRDLQEIKNMQKETLELQRASMQMLRELAVMIDENHRESLYMMESIYRELRSVKELGGIVAERDLRACQEIVLSATYGFRSEKPLSIGIRDVDSIKSQIKGNIASLYEFSHLIRNSAEDDWQRCQSFLSSTFSNLDRKSSPIYARLAYRADTPSGVALEQDLYQPAWKYLKASTYGGHWLNDMSLHLPVNNMAALRRDKAPYLRAASSGSEMDRDSLDDLLAPEALEKYVATLLTVQTLVSFNAEQWVSLPKNLGGARDRAERWMRPALRQVQIAVAQEAILAGEPILHELASNWLTLLQDKVNCSTQKGDYCFARQNTLLMRNLLTYMLYQRRGDLNDTEPYKNQVANLLGLPLSRLEEKNGKLYLMLSDQGFNGLVTEVPNREVAKKGNIEYSENMLKLIEMQSLLASELSRLSIKGEGRSKDLAKLLLLGTF